MGASFWTSNGGTDLPNDHILHSLCDSLVLNDGSNLQDYAWYCGSSFPETHEVGQKIKNGFGSGETHVYSGVQIDKNSYFRVGM